MLEKTIEKYLRAQCKAAGFLCRKVCWVGMNGCPDRLIMTPAATLWVELKSPNKEPTLQQQREHARMREAGQNVVFTDSKAGVDVIIKMLKELNSEK